MLFAKGWLIQNPFPFPSFCGTIKTLVTKVDNSNVLPPIEGWILGSLEMFQTSGLVLRCFHHSVDSILLVSKIEIPLYWFRLYWFILIYFSRTSMYMVQSTEPLTCWKADTLHILKWLILKRLRLQKLQKLGALTPALHVLLQPWCGMDGTLTTCQSYGI